MELIKVRMWNGTGNRFHFGRMAMDCLMQQNCGAYDHVGRGGAFFELFTGRTDSNGIEIFAGDILDHCYTKYPEDDKQPYVVVFHDGAFRIKRQNWPENLPMTVLSSHEISILSDHVIGNIHQHSHLLKGE